MKTLICIFFHRKFHLVKFISSEFNFFVEKEIHTYKHCECLKCQRKWKERIF